MTASTETTTDNQVEPDTEQGDAQEVEDTTGDDRPGAEAARYRRRLRDTETERDGLVERLAGYQRREVERIAGEALARPGDVWLDGADVGAVLDDEGQVDANKVAEVAASVLDGRPGLAKVVVRRPRPDHAQGAPASRGGASWGDVLKARER